MRGDLITLRPLHADDFEDLYAVASDPLIWELHPARDRYKREVFEQFFLQAVDSKSALVVLEAGRGLVIGTSRYALWDDDPNALEIGWTFLAREYWGGAYNAQLKGLMLEHAFRFVPHVRFIVGPQNYRSQRALAKIGAISIGSRKEPSGQFNLVYQITRPVQ